MGTTYIPNRIDAVLQNLKDQQEIWQKEAQHKKEMGVKMYQLGMQSEDDTMKARGMNAMEGRGFLGSSYNVPGYDVGQGGGQTQNAVADDSETPVEKYKPKTMDEARAFAEWSMKSNRPEDAGSTKLLKENPLAWMQKQASRVDFSELSKNKDEWNGFMSYLANGSSDQSLNKNVEPSKQPAPVGASQQKPEYTTVVDEINPERMMNAVDEEEATKRLGTQSKAMSEVGKIRNIETAPSLKDATALTKNQDATLKENWTKARANIKEIATARKNKLDAESQAYDKYKVGAFKQLDSHFDKVERAESRAKQLANSKGEGSPEAEMARATVASQKEKVAEAHRLLSSPSGTDHRKAMMLLYENDLEEAGNNQRKIAIANAKFMNNLNSVRGHFGKDEKYDKDSLADIKIYGGGGSVKTKDVRVALKNKDGSAALDPVTGQQKYALVSVPDGAGTFDERADRELRKEKRYDGLYADSSVLVKENTDENLSGAQKDQYAMQKDSAKVAKTAGDSIVNDFATIGEGAPISSEQADIIISKRANDLNSAGYVAVKRYEKGTKRVVNIDIVKADGFKDGIAYSKQGGDNPYIVLANGKEVQFDGREELKTMNAGNIQNTIVREDKKSSTGKGEPKKVKKGHWKNGVWVID